MKLQQRHPKFHYHVPHNYSSKEQCLYVISSKPNYGKWSPIQGSINNIKNFQRKDVISPTTQRVSTRAYNKKDYDYLAKFPLSTTKLLYTNNKNEILKLGKNGMGYETSINSSMDSIASYGSPNSDITVEFSSNDFDSNHKLHINTEEFDSYNLNLKHHKLHNTEVDLDPYNFLQSGHEVPNIEVEFDSNKLVKLEHELHNTKVVYNNRSVAEQIQQKICNIEEKFDTKNSALQQKNHEKENTSVSIPKSSLRDRETYSPDKETYTYVLGQVRKKKREGLSVGQPFTPCSTHIPIVTQREGFPPQATPLKTQTPIVKHRLTATKLSHHVGACVKKSPLNWRLCFLAPMTIE